MLPMKLDALTLWSIKSQEAHHPIRHTGYDLCQDVFTAKINME